MPYVCSSGDVGFEVGDDAPSICALGVERLFSQRGIVVLCEGFPRRASIRFFWGDGWVVGLETGDYEPVEEAIVERGASVVECEHLALVQRVRNDDLRHFLVFELRTYPYRTSLVPKPPFENSTKCARPAPFICSFRQPSKPWWYSLPKILSAVGGRRS